VGISKLGRTDSRLPGFRNGFERRRGLMGNFSKDIGGEQIMRNVLLLMELVFFLFVREGYSKLISRHCVLVLKFFRKFCFIK